MVRPRRHLALALAAAAMAGAAGCPEEDPAERPLTVFAAASLQDALDDVAAAFTRAHGAPVVFNFAGSHVLAQQLVAAGPVADVFLSADERWMDHVAQAGHLVAGSRGAPLGNRLVVVANARAAYAPLGSGAELGALGFEHLALGDPRAVPAGRYARAWLEALPAPAGGTVWEAVQARLAPAADARAALALVEADPAVVGVVYRSDAAASRRVKVLWEVPADRGPPIRYAAALVKRQPAHPKAAAFLDFVSSDAGRLALEAHGFLLPPAAEPAGE